MKQPILLAAALASSLAAVAQVSVSSSGDSAVITPDARFIAEHTQASRYLMLPIEESAPEARVRYLTGSADDVPLDIHLALRHVDYYVPFRLTSPTATLSVHGAPADALWAKSLTLSDAPDVANREPNRPLYHHTPAYGWMNDPNGMFYRDGTYHLYYQYNPYGSMWGNLAWGHSTSTDLVNWQPQPVALERDTLGMIFSGSCVVDERNTAGFGRGAVIAFYTAAGDGYQVQAMAYSTDGGKTFTKYAHNPILTPFDGLRDFRDPKVFWYAPQKKWVMIVSADKNVRFYSSKNLRQWTYMSQWGDGYGAKPSQFECPDLFPLGDKWVMLVNVNPGGAFGGSATQYFVGQFDGTTFTPDCDRDLVRWLDFGKDHYAAVTFAGKEPISMSWMSNWQYANTLPTLQYRSANGLARRLSLYEQDGVSYVAGAPICAVADSSEQPLNLLAGQTASLMPAAQTGAYRIALDLKPAASGETTLRLAGSDGERLDITFNTTTGRVAMDRAHSSAAVRVAAADWNTVTTAPLKLCGPTAAYHVELFIDRSSAELFVAGGRIAMTNVIFPTKPYDTITLTATAQGAVAQNTTVAKIK